MVDAGGLTRVGMEITMPGVVILGSISEKRQPAVHAPFRVFHDVPTTKAAKPVRRPVVDITTISDRRKTIRAAEEGATTSNMTSFSADRIA